ncbi:DUF2306 domain-containing protein [Aquimarina macrocephali]|uniref:DUF2306 domain-containing protein n=1 Tax=Aquimarina macrocephali TaxID=666563 RepID=UPI003F681F74
MRLKGIITTQALINSIRQIRYKKVVWVVFAILAISIGLYPLTFLAVDTNTGLLGHKSEELLSSVIWNFAFYMHIFLGGVALIIGWSLFIKKFRVKNIGLHRIIGKIYVSLVLLSGITGFYIAVYATGGIIAKLGFSGMSIAWLITTIIAYTSIRNRNIKKHQRWMIRSYAVTFVGVTFRLWMPILLFVLDMKFIEAYRVDSWISWILNLVFAELIIKKTVINEITSNK